MSTSAEGLDQPSTNGEGYDRTQLANGGEPERIFPVNLESGAIIIIAHPDNAGRIHLGFDDSVDANTGLTIEAGNGISFGLNVSEQPIFFVGPNAGDEVRWMAIN